jgi:hypothetical protein
MQEMKNQADRSEEHPRGKQTRQAQLEPLQEQAEQMITMLETEKYRMEQCTLRKNTSVEGACYIRSWRPS